MNYFGKIAGILLLAGAMTLFSGCDSASDHPGMVVVDGEEDENVEVYSVLFNLNGGTLISGETEQQIKRGKAAVAPEVENGNKILTWDKDFSRVTGNIIVSAVWSAPTYTVTFDPGVEGMEPVAVTVEEGSAAAAPEFVREGMELAGWDGDISAVKSDLTVKAIWQRKAMTGVEISAYADTRTATVRVTDVYGNPSSGSGFFIDDKGTLVTNYHVIELANTLSAEMNNGAAYAVKKVLNFSEKFDLAILQVDISGNDYFDISHEITKGERVYAMGSALGELTGTMTTGIVSSTSRTVGVIECIQMDASISGGNSGGPLLNEFGEVIGINSFSYTNGTNLNLAIQVDMLDQLPEARNFSVNDYVEWWRTEIDRSYRPTNAQDTEYFQYSILNTYQQVTGAKCVLSINDITLESGSYADGYDARYLYYIYNYSSSQYDKYVKYLKEMGYEYDVDESETYNDGVVSYYYSTASGITVMLLQTYENNEIYGEALIVSTVY